MLVCVGHSSSFGLPLEITQLLRLNLKVKLRKIEITQLLIIQKKVEII
jgi:hypothetical protein